jgi:hypothetical protein
MNEYTIVKLDGTLKEDIETLNTYDANGWELVNVVKVNDEVQLAYLKHRKEENPTIKTYPLP